MANANNNKPPLVRLEHVGRTFRMGEVSVEVLKDVNLEVAAGEIMIVVGPSGSGKTTMLNLIGGLDQPTIGHVWFRQKDLSRISARELSAYRRESVGFVFQFYNLIPNLTARENIMVSAELSQAPMDVDESLALVGLSQRADHFPSQLSGGEQQRVSIARAIAKNPDLLLCDEPTGALDFETGKMVLSLLQRVASEMNKTVVLITHNAAISEMGHHIVRLRSGHVVEWKVNPAPISAQEIVW